MFSLMTKIEARNKNMRKFLAYPVNKICDVPLKALEMALEAEKASKYDDSSDVKLKNQRLGKSKFVGLISLLGAKYDGDWSSFEFEDANDFLNRLKKGVLESELSKPYENYDYFKKIYSVLFGDMVGSYRISKKFNENNEPVFDDMVGLKSYFPIPYDFSATFCDDYEPENKYLSSKFHLGVDVFAKIKTPIVAVESGIVEDCGKTEEFGWQVSIKSFDGLRTLHYSNCFGAHPFSERIRPGALVKAGQVIGYVGATSCCKQKTVRAKNCPHLHFAVSLNLKFGNRSKKVWINPYNILQFLQHHKSVVVKRADSFDFENKYVFEDPTFEKYVVKNQQKQAD